MPVFENTRFITCEAEGEVFSKMAAGADGRILWLGDDLPAEYASMPRIDLGGAVAVPAFGDTHMHFESFSTFENTFNISDAHSFDEAAAIVRTYAEAHPREKLLIGFGACGHLVREGRLPNREDLDRWAARPLIIVKYDGHAAVCNSAMMSFFSSKVTDDPGFHADGWLYQSAFYNGVNEVTAKLSPLSIVGGLSKGAAALTAAGIGLVHAVEGVGYPRDMDVDMLRMLEGGLPQTFRIFFQTMDVSKVLKRRMKRIGGCFELALDGCFGSEDAALLEPYTNNPDNRGVLNYTQEQVNAFAIAANRAGLQITMHAIGDAAVEQCITAYEAALADLPRPDHRHIMIHCCMVSPSQLDRIAALGLCLAVQAPFIDWAQEPDRYLREILGDRADGLNPLRSMWDRGIVIADGSDAPCTRPDPIRGMHLAVNHPNPAQRLRPYEALLMRTRNAAWLGFDERERGTLAPGKRADFTLLDADPLTIPPQSIGDIRVTGLYLRARRIPPQAGGVAHVILRALAGGKSRK